MGDLYLIPPQNSRPVIPALIGIKDNEVWKPMNSKIYPSVKFDNYYISSKGRVFSKSHSIMLALEESINGYLRVSLYRSHGYNVHCLVNRLVLSAFSLIDNMNLFQVNHINGIKHDNRLENLEWVTSSENTIHAIRNGLRNPRLGDDCILSKISYNTADNIAKMIASKKYTQSEIANIMNCKKSTVTNIAVGAAWTDLYIKYRLNRIINRPKHVFNDDDILKIKEFLKYNINNYGDDLIQYKYLCMDISYKLFNMTLNRALFLELLDICLNYRDFGE